VVLIGEMRDLETIEAAHSPSPETGHLAVRDAAHQKFVACRTDQPHRRRGCPGYQQSQVRASSLVPRGECCGQSLLPGRRRAGRALAIETDDPEFRRSAT